MKRRTFLGALVALPFAPLLARLKLPEPEARLDKNPLWMTAYGTGSAPVEGWGQYAIDFHSGKPISFLCDGCNWHVIDEDQGFFIEGQDA